MKRTFFYPCNPRGQGRPRFAGKVAYKSSEDRAYEQGIRMAYVSAYPGRAPIQGACSVTITALYPIPKSASKKMREQMIAGLVLPIVRPDIDNVYKAVLDALNGVAFMDDKQVTGGEMHKFYGAVPGLMVEIEEVEHGEAETLPILHEL
jgi:Holliday junction resolvase RusA-like endonuclease